MNNPAASCGVSELGDEICLKGVTPECFNRGSTSSEAACGEPVEPPLKACGNDGLWIGNLVNGASGGESTHRDLISTHHSITPLLHHSNTPIFQPGLSMTHTPAPAPAARFLQGRCRGWLTAAPADQASLSECFSKNARP